YHAVFAAMKARGLRPPNRAGRPERYPCLMRKGIALTALLAFGCATVRMPAGSVGDEVGPVRGIVAEPQVELWLESGDPVTAQEASEAREQARAALQQALETQAIAPTPMGASDPVLVVRERGLSRTASRRRDQVGATIGLVVGAVVVVAVVVALVVAGKGDPGKSAAPKAAPAVA